MKSSQLICFGSCVATAREVLHAVPVSRQHNAGNSLLPVSAMFPLDLTAIPATGQRRHTEADELACALAGAEEEAARARHALEECQGMVAELQAFSEAAQARAQVRGARRCTLPARLCRTDLASCCMPTASVLHLEHTSRTTLHLLY